ILLSLIGVVVVARDQIFIGAAISQASTLGIAAALWLGTVLPENSWIQTDAGLSLMAIVFSVAAALATARTGTKEGESHEAITGWVFLFSASFAILVVTHSPH